MFPPISELLSEYEQLTEFLNSSNEVSLAISVNNHFRKIYILSCASYYELQITNMLKEFVNQNSSDPRIMAFSTAKGIERQYHTYFDWNQTRNINNFTGLFGAEFKAKVQADIRASSNLGEQIEAFLILGSERNKMVHNNFLECQLEKTFPEIRKLDELATKFVEYLQFQFTVSTTSAI